ncbi:MAG: T9SS type A sorting domain-containing protein [Bacteroidetes bacterium]|nr:T9SS type A sorting domain-containing protein [Bacteroidota bacterium]
MKKIYFALSALLLATAAHSQSKTVILNVEHRIGTDTCATGVEGINNLGNPFKLNRIQYYMDEIILVHDGGSSDTAAALALVDGFNETSLTLGTFTVDSLESIRFAIGVNASLNHLDPTTYNPNHPLAPKSPSMHWGWTAGYRFIAAEGLGGSAFSQIFEFHGLGDGNYAHLTVPTSGTLIASDTLLITITADYNELFRGINLGSGPISHGETGGAAQTLHNINNYVFTSSEGNAAMGLTEKTPVVGIYPNPSNGQFIIESPEAGTYEVLDMLGRKVMNGTLFPGANNVNLNANGLLVLCINSLEGETTVYKLHVK